MIPRSVHIYVKVLIQAVTTNGQISGDAHEECCTTFYSGLLH